MRNKALDYVNSQLRLDPATGILWWRVGARGRRKEKPAGGLDSKGYIRLRLVGLHGAKRILAHRIIWFLAYGYWPTGGIDHKDRNPLNNRIENLRLASRSQNAQNSKVNSKNTSGFKGVHFDKAQRKWRASIKLLGRKTYLGSFTSKEEAIKARKDAEPFYFRDFSPDKGVTRGT